MVRVLASVFSATATTSSSDAALSALAPAVLKAKTMPATPRRRSASSGGAEATSSLTSTVRTSMSSISAISRGHVKVHDIAAVVAVDVDHALAAVDALGDGQHLVGAG